MTRLLGFLVRNWPLKLGALVLATVAYAGLILSQNARTWPGPVPIQVINQPTSAFIVGALPDVTNIRYFAAVGASDQLSSAAFAATLDLRDAQVDPSQPFMAQVKLQGPTSITILDYTPQQVLVRLDPVVTRTVPVTVSHGIVPPGLQVTDPQLSQPTVSVTGPASVVDRVVAAEARVRIQSSGIDVDQLVDLVPVDARDEVLTPVDLNPAAVRVRIAVSSPVTTKSVPVTAVVTGTPADGFSVAGTTITPAVATVTGESTLLANLASVSTKPVDVGGASATVTRTVGLELPDGITSVGGATFTVDVTLRTNAATRNFTAAITLVGTSSDRTYSLAVDTVVVTLGGGEQALNGVDAASFTASVAVAGLGAGSHDLGVVVTAPAGLSLLSVSPPRITVFVGEPATPPPTPSPVPTPSPSPSPSVEPSSSPITSGEASPSAAGSGEPSVSSTGSPQPSPSSTPSASP